MNKDNSEKILGILSRITGKKIIRLDTQKDLSSQVKLDSIQFVELIAAIEKEFDVEIPLSMISGNSLDDFISEFEKMIE
jgi:acyl carrier protein